MPRAGESSNRTTRLSGLDRTETRPRTRPTCRARRIRPRSELRFVASPPRHGTFTERTASFGRTISLFIQTYTPCFFHFFSCLGAEIPIPSTSRIDDSRGFATACSRDPRDAGPFPNHLLKKKLPREHGFVRRSRSFGPFDHSNEFLR